VRPPAAPLAALLLGTLLGEPVQAAGVAAQAEMMFNTLLNTTSPTAHMGQRRGVFDGGSVVARTRIMNESLVSVVPPSFEAGCGGIDMFAGSFSFISAEQFQALLRAIAANAPGYAFKVAISSMCPTCGEVMDSLQKIVQRINEMNLHSCELAKGVVNDVAEAMGHKQEDNASMIGMIKGWGDAFEMRSTTTGRTPVDEVDRNLNEDQAAQAGLQGNLVWKALREHAVEDWFGSGDTRLLEAIMSITGSVIVQSPQQAPDGEGKAFKVDYLQGNLMTVRDLLWGSRQQDGADQAAQRIEQYRCENTSATRCLRPTPVELTDVKGLAVQVRHVLLGRPGHAGLVDKFSISDATLTSDERSFLEHAPNGIGAQLRNLARHDAGMARAYAYRAAPIIALEMVSIVVNDLLRSAESAVALENNAYAKQVIQQIRAAREQVNDEQQLLAARHGNAQTMLAYYTDMIRAAKRDTSMEF